MILIKASFVLILLFLIYNRVMAIEGQGTQDVEIGLVTWERNFDHALKLSKEQNKPVLALFQEVPGCLGCQNFGKEVLSDTDTVKLIEKEFIPVLIYNNRSGKDAKLLKKFGEPAWNFQVIRFFDSNANDIIPRKDKVWTLAETRERIDQALKIYQKKTVKNQELSQIAFAQHCFWTGEMKLGAIDGVEKTEAGFIDGHEVTRVWFNPQEITEQQLIVNASSMNLASKVYSYDQGRSNIKDSYKLASQSDQKKQLEGTGFEKISMSDFQKTKVNAYVRTDLNKAISFLSENQKELLGK